MAIPLADYAEQLNPQALQQVPRRVESFMSAKRYQEAFTAPLEKRVLTWLAGSTPAWIHSDHLTMLGFVAQLLAGAGFAVARWNKYGLLVVVAALALNWLGDSLDGTLARYRNQQRPRYGFYVDHMVDSIGAVALMGGLALSGYMHPYVAIALLIAFLLLSIQSYLATYTLGEFRLSFWRLGPTELRILLAIGSLALFIRGPNAHLAGRQFRLFDIGGLVGIVGMIVILAAATITNTIRLYHEEKPR